MDKKEITELIEKSYYKGYNEGFYDAAKEFKRLVDAAVTSYQEIAKEKLKEVNKYWESKANEKANEKRTDK